MGKAKEKLIPPGWKDDKIYSPIRYRQFINWGLKMEKMKLLGLGGLAAAGFGSICCVGPVVLAGLGFGAGTISFARGFGILHTPLVVLAVLFLGAAFYFQYRKKEPNPEQAPCCKPKSGNIGKNPAILWFATGLTIFLFLFPYFI